MESDEKQRDRSRTEQSILAAARRVLGDKGFLGWGINGIAREAGCDKQLIYRYFHGLDGLADAIGEEMAAWLDEALSARPGQPPARSYAELVTRLLLEFLDALRANRLAQRIIAWELAEQSPLVVRFAAARGRAMGAWIARERGALVPPEGLDVAACNAVLIAAVQQLALAGAASGRFSGVALAGEQDWERIREAVRTIAAAAYR